jgi:hypothetical protein
MATILGTLFFGVSVLAHHLKPFPSHEETVFSQMGRVVFGTGPVDVTIRLFESDEATNPPTLTQEADARVVPPPGRQGPAVGGIRQAPNTPRVPGQLLALGVELVLCFLQLREVQGRGHRDTPQF